MYTSVGDLRTSLRQELQSLQEGPREWVVLVGDRLVIAGLLTAVFGGCVAALVATGEIAVDSPRMIYVYQVLVGGNLTLITIVLSINQLVLSREFNTPGELHEQIENVIAYRSRVESTVHGDTPPATPGEFFPVLIDGTRENAQRLGGVVARPEHERLACDVDRLVSRVTEHTDHMRGVLDYSNNEVFDALAATLETNHSSYLREAYRIRSTYRDELTPATEEVLGDLITVLKQVDIARQYFKSLFMQSELARLSQILLYVGVPAVGSALVVFLLYIGEPGGSSSPQYHPALALAVTTLGFAPLAVLFSFVLRIATVARRTVAITPFTTSPTEADGGRP